MTASNQSNPAPSDDIWLAGARACTSPNFNQRPDNTTVSLLVIHNISLPPGDFSTDAVERFFCNQLVEDEHPYYAQIAHLQVSAHLFIRRTGELVQFVPLNHRAWHAGVSEFEDSPNCNDYSIGIELEGTDNLPYTQAQYDVLAQVTRSLLQRYPAIAADRIVGHSDIAPARKTDPGPAFDWAHYHSMIGANLNKDNN